MKQVSREQLLAVLRTDLVQRWQADTELSSLMDIADIGDGLEDKIPALIRSTLIDNAALIYRSMKVLESDLYDIAIRSHKFEIIAHKDILKPTEFIVAFVNREVNSSDLRVTERKMALVDCGQYTTLRLIVPAKTAIDLELLHEIVQTVFTVTYEWFEHRIYELCTDNCLAAAGLYGTLKRIIPKELVRSVWLIALIEEKAYYLLSEDVIRQSIALTEPASKEIDRHPLRLLSELILMKMPLKEGMAQDVIKEGKCIDRSIGGSRYADTKSLLAIAEIAVFEGDSLSLLPIYLHESHLLLAVFPTAKRAELEPLLELNRSLLEQQYKSYLSRIRRVWAKFENRRKDLHLGQLGEFVGGVIHGLLRP